MLAALDADDVTRAVLLVDDDGTIVKATSAAQRLLDDLAPLGRALSALEPDLAPDAIARIERAVRTPPPPPPRAAPQRTRAGLVTTLRVATLTAPQSTVGRVLTRFAALLAGPPSTPA